ncbi:hypothetical protein FF2_032453 [Malus domestica]
MAVLITLSVARAGAGFRFSDDLQRLGCLQPRLCQSPTTIFPHKCLHYSCFWQAPRSKNLNLKSKELPRLHLASTREAEDSFTLFIAGAGAGLQNSPTTSKS